MVWIPAKARIQEAYPDFLRCYKLRKLGVFNMAELITSFQKNSLEEIRISLLKYKSYQFIDLRIFSAPQRGEEKKSTSSGMTLPVALFSDLKSSILDVEKMLIERKLLSGASDC